MQYYFFEQLKSPVWIEPLAKEKLFSKPYNAIRRGETLSFPVWVPGTYLARMAAIPDAQAEALELFKNLPESDNPAFMKSLRTRQLRFLPKWPRTSYHSCCAAWNFLFSSS